MAGTITGRMKCGPDDDAHAAMYARHGLGVYFEPSTYQPSAADRTAFNLLAEARRQHISTKTLLKELGYDLEAEQAKMQLELNSKKAGPKKPAR